MNANLAMWLPGGTEWILIALVALLLFGRRLPEVARSLGKSIVEFKKGVRDIGQDIEQESARQDPPAGTAERRSLPPGSDDPTSTSKPADRVANSHSR